MSDKWYTTYIGQGIFYAVIAVGVGIGAYFADPLGYQSTKEIKKIEVEASSRV